MDRKSIIVIIVCLGLMLLWPTLTNKLYPPKVQPPAPTNEIASTQSMALTNVAGTAPAGMSNAPSLPSGLAQFVTETNEELLVVTNAQARYTFTSRGGGLKLIELLQFPEAVQRKKESHAGHVAALNENARVPALAILDGEAVQGDSMFQLTQTASGVRTEKQLTNGLRITKEFTLSSNYMVNVSVKFENHAGEKLSLPRQEWTIGTATPMSPEDRGQIVGLIWSDGSKVQTMIGGSYFSGRGFMCMPRNPPSEYREGQSNVVWAAVENQFFALATIARQPAAQIVSRKIDLPLPTVEELQENPTATRFPQGYETAMVYPAFALEPNQTFEREFVLFAGPKEYRTIARLAAQLNINIDALMGFDNIFPFYRFGGFFAKALLLAMNTIHKLFPFSYGWVIIVLTVVLKLLFWPLTAASTRSMKRMQALQPQMKAIQAKYKDDPVKMNKKTMEFMKENKVSPLGGCLPMLIQMPVFFGFYTMIRSAIELRGASFLWIPDLSKPDTLFMIPGTTIPFNLLPLIMGGTMLWQSHLTPPSPGWIRRSRRSCVTCR